MKELAKILTENKLKISTAESCTGGLIAGEITSVSGSSEFFDLSVVTYANEAKMKLINVSEDTLKTYGAVSEQTAYEMVKGISDLSGAETCIAVTGLAGPGGGTTEKPVGLVYVATKVFDKINVKKYNFDGNRDEIRLKTVNDAINDIKQMILNEIRR